jgi:hypothetical protein
MRRFVREEDYLPGTPQSFIDAQERALQLIVLKHAESPQAHSKFSPGDVAKYIISKLGLGDAERCSECRAFQWQMNRWGWWQCWKRRKNILAWFVTKARAKGVVVDEESFYRLFKAGAKFARTARRLR